MVRQKLGDPWYPSIPSFQRSWLPEKELGLLHRNLILLERTGYRVLQALFCPSRALSLTSCSIPTKLGMLVLLRCLRRVSEQR